MVGEKAGWSPLHGVGIRLLVGMETVVLLELSLSLYWKGNGWVGER